MNDDIMNKSMVIYLITNKLNGKQYVGQTVRKLKERMYQHMNGDLYIDLALKKHGIENFTVEVLEECATLDELNEREKYWIKTRNTLEPNGYNCTDGGDNAIPTDESRRRNSEAHKQAYKNPEILARHSAGQKRRFEREEERQKVVDFMTGRTMPPEVCAKISATMTELCSDPEERKRKSERAKASHARPEVRQKDLETLERVRNDPDIQKKRAESIRARASDPESHRRRSEAQKRRQARERAEREAQRNNVEIPLDFH